MTVRAVSRSGQRWPLGAMAGAVLVCVGGVVLGGAQAPAAGTISGHVTLTSRMRGVPIATNAYSPRAVTAQGAPALPEARSVVVFLKDAPFSGTLAAGRAEIRQDQESFSPRVVAITRGSSITFPNFDPYFHNVFSLSRAATFDLGRFANGQSRTRQFDKAGIVKVYCHIHSQMSATILVLDHPYFTIPSADGQFTLPAVPAGDYTLAAWHERLGEQTMRVTVAPGRNVTTEISLPLVDAR